MLQHSNILVLVYSNEENTKLLEKSIREYVCNVTLLLEE